MLFFGISSTYAQNPSFIVEWNPCELQVSGSTYTIQYAIFNTTTNSYVVPFTTAADNISQTITSYIIEVDSWDCNQMDTKPYLYIYAKVQLIKDGVTYCSGNALSNLLTCDEMYNNVTTLTVNLEN
jgi:hypothetical protein